MNVLIACESSGAVRSAFRNNGHNAWSCDLLPADDASPYHFQSDVREIIMARQWDLMVAHPPCTYLCSSGLHWNNRVVGREQKTVDALAFVEFLMAAPIARWAIENPVGRIGTAIKPATQYVQPYDYGENMSKTTGLWLKNLPFLRPTEYVPGRWVCCGETIPDECGKYGCPYCLGDKKPKMRWANQCNNFGDDKTPPSPDRWKLRSATTPGIANAMADQWGNVSGFYFDGNLAIV